MKKTYEAPYLEVKTVASEPMLAINSIVKTRKEDEITDGEKILVRKYNVWDESEEEE